VDLEVQVAEDMFDKACIKNQRYKVSLGLSNVFTAKISMNYYDVLKKIPGC
jgi:hypothetical protein